MKPTFYLLIVVSALIVSCKDSLDNTTPEGTAELIANYVIANDSSGLMGMIITEDEMKKAIASSNAPSDGKEFAISRVKEEVQVMKTDIKNGLEQIRTAGTATGIIWEDCSFKEAVPTIDKSRGFEMMRLKCILECDGSEYVFTVTDIVGTQHGWKLAGKMMFGEPKPQIRF